MNAQTTRAGRSPKGPSRGKRTPGAGPTKGRILVVEDEQILRDAMGPLLEERGHEVVFAENGREALRRLHESPIPDIIVLDLRMPIMDGWEFRALQKGDPELDLIPVVAISADGSAQAAAISADAYLRKPVAPAELLATIDRVLGERAHRMPAPADETRRFAYLKRLVASVGHEVNNPLTIVTLNLSQSLEDLQPSIQELDQYGEMTPGPSVLHEIESRLVGVTEMLEECQVGAERIRKTISKLQRLSYQGEEPPAVLDVHEVIEEGVTEAWSEVRRRARLIKVFGHVRPIFGEGKALRQVFRSLLVCMAQTLSSQDVERNEIKISTRLVVADSGAGVLVEVIDSGMNTPRDDGAARRDPSVTTWLLGEGAAMGLAASEETIRRHGGHLNVEMNAGKARVFQVFLPFGDQSETEFAPATTPSAPGAALATRRILVVEDEAHIARNVEKALGGLHHVVLTQRASEAIVRLERGETFDLVLCDVEMPGVTGAGFYDAVEERWPQLLPRLVFMTGGAFSVGTATFLATSAIKVLTKPFTVKRLKQFVRDNLATTT